MFKSFLNKFKNSWIYKKFKKEEDPLNEDLLQILKFISESPNLFEVSFKNKYFKHKKASYIYLKHKELNITYILFLGYVGKNSKEVFLEKMLSQFYCDKENLSCLNLKVPKEIKKTFYSNYLYKYTEKAKIQEIKTSLLFGVKND